MNDKTENSVRCMADLPELATVRQIADAANVNVKTIYKMIDDGQLKSIRIRRCVRVNRDSALAAFGLAGE